MEEIIAKLNQDLETAKKDLENFKADKTCSYQMLEVYDLMYCEVSDEDIVEGEKAYAVNFIDDKYVCENHMEYYLIQKVGNIALRLEMAKESM